MYRQNVLSIILVALSVELQLSKSAPIQGNKFTRTIEQHEQHAIIGYGDTVELECKFKSPITKCAWSRRGSLLEITERYSYVRGNGNATADCNVYIRDFQKIDEGLWQCERMADSSSGSIKSTSVDLSGSYDSNFRERLPRPEILEHDDYEKKYGNSNNKKVKRSINGEFFAYACVLENVANVKLYWEVNGIKIRDSKSKDVFLERITYRAAFLSQKSRMDVTTFKEGDVLKCKAKFMDSTIPELSATFTIGNLGDSQRLSVESELNSTSKNIIIGLGAIIAILFLVLIIFTGILIHRHSDDILHEIKKIVHISKEQKNSPGNPNQGYIIVTEKDELKLPLQKNLTT